MTINIINYKDLPFYTFFNNGIHAVNIEGIDENDNKINKLVILLFDRKYKAINLKEKYNIEADIKRINYTNIYDHIYKKYKNIPIMIVAGPVIKDKLKNVKGITPDMFLDIKDKEVK